MRPQALSAVSLPIVPITSACGPTTAALTPPTPIPREPELTHNSALQGKRRLTPGRGTQLPRLFLSLTPAPAPNLTLTLNLTPNPNLARRCHAPTLPRFRRPHSYCSAANADHSQASQIQPRHC